MLTGERFLQYLGQKGLIETDPEETSMDTNKWILGAALCLCLGASGCALIQHYHSNRGMGSGPILGTDTPAAKARFIRIARLDEAAILAQKAGDYAEAEDYVRQSIAIGQDAGVAQEVLASALNAQGKTQEALQAYKVIADRGGVFPRNMVPYARLLLESGQWASAVAAYNKMLIYFSADDLVKANSYFSPDIPQPKELAIMLHIEQGLTDIGGASWGSGPQPEKAMTEFAQALRLAPDSALANYYYGFGWQHLDRKSPTREAYAQKAKAALQKAAAIGTGEVQKSAQEALRGQ